jgi:hypothetical protein
MAHQAELYMVGSSECFFNNMSLHFYSSRIFTLHPHESWTLNMFVDSVASISPLQRPLLRGTTEEKTAVTSVSHPPNRHKWQHMSLTGKYLTSTFLACLLNECSVSADSRLNIIHIEKKRSRARMNQFLFDFE